VAEIPPGARGLAKAAASVQRRKPLQPCAEKGKSRRQYRRLF